MDSNFCAVCSEPSEKFCSNCCQVYYCSPDHQKGHWKVHKGDCFPCKIVTDAIQGRFLVATRPILAGGLIFKDKELISGPCGSENEFWNICLSCYRVLNGNQDNEEGKFRCPKCQWIMCGIGCSKAVNHAEFECPIFAKRKITNFLKPHEYAYLYILRTLLLRHRRDGKWEKALEFVSHDQNRLQNKSMMKGTNEIVHFIRDKLGLEEFNFDTVHKIEGIWSVNSYGMGAAPKSSTNSNCRLATFLFPRLKYASHNCTPNTRGVIKPSKSHCLEYSMELYASIDIGIGQSITTCYIEPGLGTIERRRILKDCYFFDCTCERCTDSTEFGTFSSSILCPACKANLIPENPLDTQTLWKCTKNCQKYKPLEYVQLEHQYLTNIQYDLNQIEVAPRSKTEIVQSLEKLLNQIKGQIVHKNHWLVMEIEYRLILGLKQRLYPGLIDSKEKLKWTINKIIELCKHCLEVAQFIRFGENIYRGRILYCLVHAKLKLHQNFGFNTSKSYGKKEMLEEIRDLAKEGYKILSVEAENSEEIKLAKYLEQDINDIDLVLSVSVDSNNGKSGFNKNKSSKSKGRKV